MVIQTSVLWGDQDSLGHVNHAVYLRWLESARFSYMSGVHLQRLDPDDHVGPILAAVKCNYRSQLSFPDTVYISASTSRIGRTSITFDHEVYSETQKRIVADAEAVIVVFDFASQRSVAVPETVRTAIQEAEGKTFA